MVMSEDGELDFELFSSSLDFFSPDEIEQNKKKASMKEINEMCKFIGGFENWSSLIDDCKRKVVEFLDCKTRFSLAVCSTADNEIVKSIAMDVQQVEMIDNQTHHYQYQDEAFENVVVKVQFHEGFHFERIFSQTDDDTQVRWTQYAPRIRPLKKSAILKNCNYYQEAVAFGEMWIKRGNFGLEKITIEMKKYPLESSMITSLPKCTSIRLCSTDENVLRWWFERVPEELEDLQLLTRYDERQSVTISRELLSTNHVMNAKRFYFWARADFSDEQILKLKADRISFDTVSITDDGINQFVKHWMNGQLYGNFKDILLWSKRKYDQSAIFNGIEARLWDGHFEEESRGFCFDFRRCCGDGTTFQISSKVDPYESLSLNISNDCVAIYHTGRKCTWGGVTRTSYGIP